MHDYVQKAFKDHLSTTEQSQMALADEIVRIAQLLITCLERGNKIMLSGNGGSAADAQHIAAELTGRYMAKNRKPLPAIALTTDTSALTALGNDFGFDEIFARQVEALGRSGDVLIGISTSGNSQNIVRAFKVAHARGILTVLLTGGNGGILKSHSDHALVVPASETPRIQEAHITLGHILCGLVDRHFAVNS